jgi:histidinol-phosphate aminotransferase
VIRTASKAYALAGLRVGFGIARPEVVAQMNPFRPPGSVSTVSVTVVTEALLDPGLAAGNVQRVAAERDRLTAALTEAGWSVGPSTTNFILVDFGSVERAAVVAETLLQRGLVPRAFPASHPLADHLRLTVRDVDQDDRLIAAAREIEGR